MAVAESYTAEQNEALHCHLEHRLGTLISIVVLMVAISPGPIV